MEDTELQDQLASIRSMMERSSKFISLSGLSGISAGVYALIAAGIAYPQIRDTQASLFNGDATAPVKGLFYGSDSNIIPSMLDIQRGLFGNLPNKLFLIAILTLVASILTGFILTYLKASKNQQPIWGQISRMLLINMSIPLVAGGFFLTILFMAGNLSMLVPIALIFYGLALVNASNYTFNDVKYLGLTDIVLGLATACFPQYGLWAWAIGFGVLHIVYGSIMYLKYDR